MVSFSLTMTGSSDPPGKGIIGYSDGSAPPPAAQQEKGTPQVDNTLPEMATAPDLDEAVWEGDELVRLPKDPAARRAAREQAAALTAAKKVQAPDMVYSPTATMSTEPVRRAKWEDPFPMQLSGPEPTEWDLQNMNIRLPDDFEIPEDVLRRITEETGQIDRAAENEMASVLAQSLIQSFGGIDQTTLTPPDCDIAVGPEHVVVVVNSDYAVYDYCGTQLAAGDLGNLTNFDHFLFDPKVIYDEWDDRWVIAFVAKDTPNQLAWIRVVISSNNVPMGLGGWYWYDYGWTNNGGWWGDYPDLGVDPDAVYITTNDFNWSTPASFQRARISVLDKLEIYAALASSRDEFYAMTNPGDGTRAFALRAAEMKSDPGEYYLVSSKSGGASFLSWFEVYGNPTAGVTIGSFNIPCGLYDNPPNMPQGDGTYADCGDARLLTAKYYASRLWTTHAQLRSGTPNTSAIEVYIINTVTRVIAQETGGFWASDLYYCYPAVDFDPLDRGVVSFLRGGPGEFPQARYVDLTEGGVFSGSSLLLAGTDWKSDGSNAGTNADPYRLGDYNGCDLNRDGDNRTLWFYGHIASNSPSGSWDTHIGAVNYDGAGLLTVAPSGPTPNLV
jgi:hypothetical protein